MKFKLLLPLFLLLGATLPAAPIFPDFTRDGKAIKNSSFISQAITSPGRYLFALEDIPCPACDGDYNDVYGEVEWFGASNPTYKITVQGGLGAYYNAGTAGFSGAISSGDILTLIFTTPTGQFSSGTPQVLIYRLGDVGDVAGAPVPEPSTYASLGAALLALTYFRTKQKGAR